ncbi:MAG: phytoene desaturase family protein [Actinomycetota bacterium]
MTASYDAIVIGAGHNGLVTGAYLARAGMHTLILERRAYIGGALQTAELAPGLRVPAVAHTVGRLAGSVIANLRLAEHGLELITPAVRAFAPQQDGRAITLWRDVVRTCEELGAWSSADALAYPGFDRRVRALAGFLAHMHAATPPDLTSPSMRDALTGLKVGRAFLGLDEDDAETALRVLPMAVADFVAETFETDALRGALATRGVQYTAMGPWSAGTTAVLLADSANNDGGAPGQTTFARGGPGALASALAESARSYGAEIRTGASVAAISSSEGRVSGVALDDGLEFAAPIVASAADPKSTMLDLIDPVALGPSLRWRAGNLRLPGVVAKVNLALSGLPSFPAAQGNDERLRGRILIAPGIDALERAFDETKYGRIADPPYLEATIPSLVDDSLASDGAHVMSVFVQYAPYHLRDGDWDERRSELGDLVLRTLEDYAPGITDLVTERRVLTPLDLERDLGLTEGHPLHGEPGLDQFFAWRPLLGHAGYRLALDGLYLCGSGAHPGGGVTGAPGANAAREIFKDWKRRRAGVG